MKREALIRAITLVIQGVRYVARGSSQLLDIVIAAAKPNAQKPRPGLNGHPPAPPVRIVTDYSI